MTELPYRNLRKLMQTERPVMSQAALAKFLGRSQAVGNNIMQGTRPLSTEEAIKLARHFGVSTDVILDLVDYSGESNELAAPNGTPWRAQSDDAPSAPHVARTSRFVAGVPPQFIGRICVVRLHDGKELTGIVSAGTEPGYYLVTEIPQVGPPGEFEVAQSALVRNFTQ